MASDLDWLGVAEEAFAAAHRLSEQELARSICNRAYYSSHAAAHAVTRHFDRPYSIPSEQRTGHRKLPEQLWAALGQDCGMGKLQAKVFVDKLGECWNSRIDSDYKPGKLVGPEQAKDARDAARQLLHRARRIVK